MFTKHPFAPSQGGHRLGVYSLLLSAAVGAASAQAQPVEFPIADGGTGHFYEVVTACDFPGNTGITWDQANIGATSRVHLGAPGHLATIQSKAENDFVEQLRASVLPGACGPSGSRRTQAWIGGFQASNQAAPGDGWQWVNDEGMIPGANVPGDDDPRPYRNWVSGQPDDRDGTENNTENHLAISDGWSDEDTTPRFVGGYIVEYDVIAVSLDECVLVTEDCSPLDNQVIKLPRSARFERDAGATINFQIFERTDPRVDPVTGACHGTPGPVEPWRPFNDDSLVIPWYLCGSPNAVIVKGDASQVQIVDNTVLVVNDRVDGNLFDCEPTTVDPLQQLDVVVWQATDRNNMLETGDTAASISPELVGSAGEFTNNCGSSRGLVREASFYVLGLHIDFGIDWTLDPQSVFDRFVTLTRYKLLLLEQATDAARPVLSNGTYSKLRQQVRNTIRQLDRRDYSSALSEAENYVKFARAATFQESATGFNHEGELLMRSENIVFMLREKIIPNEL